jgi:hypothetical protein
LDITIASLQSLSEHLSLPLLLFFFFFALDGPNI